MPPARLVFVLPGLLATREESGGAGTAGETANAAAPHLARLVAAAGVARNEPDGTAAALAREYGVARQHDWPLAAIRLRALGGDPGTDYWLAADPVTLVAGRDDLRLAAAVTDLCADDAAALIATLNAHFAPDALTFSAPRPQAWFVRAPAPQALVTCALDTVAGGTLRERLPTGADAGRWRRWHNEIQMLLHEHAVNVERERQGRAPANSVWFWGGGTLAPSGAAASASPGGGAKASTDAYASATRAGGGGLASPDAEAIVTYVGGALPTAAEGATHAAASIAAALAACRGAPARVRPATLAATLADVPVDGVPPAAAVIVLDSPLDVTAVDRDWAAPAWAALARGSVESVTLIAGGNGRTAVWTAGRPGMWQRLAARLQPQDLRTALAAASGSGNGG